MSRGTAKPRQDFFFHLEQKEKEIKKLKEQIADLERTGQLPRPRQESEIFPSLREPPIAVAQPSIFSYLKQEEAPVPGLFSNLSMEKKKPSTSMSKSNQCSPPTLGSFQKEMILLKSSLIIVI